MQNPNDPKASPPVSGSGVNSSGGFVQTPDMQQKVDNVDAKVHGGEYFFPREAAQWFGLERLNKMKDTAMKGFMSLQHQPGGVQSANPQQAAPAPVGSPQNSTQGPQQPAPQGMKQPAFMQGGMLGSTGDGLNPKDFEVCDPGHFSKNHPAFANGGLLDTPQQPGAPIQQAPQASAVSTAPPAQSSPQAPPSFLNRLLGF